MKEPRCGRIPSVIRIAKPFTALPSSPGFFLVTAFSELLSPQARICVDVKLCNGSVFELWCIVFDVVLSCCVFVESACLLSVVMSV